VKDFGTVSDREDSLHEAMQRATKECDIVVTSGGVSMGELDLVKPYVEKNGKVFFGRLNMKPGKPTTFGQINRALVFALPGNPVSAFVTAHLFLVTSAKVLAGQHDCYDWQSMNVQLIPRNVKVDPERPEYHRTVAVQDVQTGKVFAFSTGSQMSSRLLSARNANSFVILPKGTPEVPVYHSSGQTKALIIGPLVQKSSKEV